MTDPQPAPTTSWDGRPLNPEVDGWHVLHFHTDNTNIVLEWSASERAWMDNGHDPVEWSSDYLYVSPVRTDADLAATARLHEAAGAMRMREVCVSVMQTEAAGHDTLGQTRDAALARERAGILKSLPIPSTSALDALIREAEARGADKEREAVAAQCESCAAEFRQLANSFTGEPTKQGLEGAAKALESQAAVIRTRGRARASQSGEKA